MALIRWIIWPYMALIKLCLFPITFSLRFARHTIRAAHS
jgi:hypothetical protein